MGVDSRCTISLDMYPSSRSAACIGVILWGLALVSVPSRPWKVA